MRNSSALAGIHVTVSFLRFACLSTLALSVSLVAQTRQPLNSDPNMRSVHGTVYSASDTPVKGAVVKLEDAKTRSVRSFISDGDGGYHFSGLLTNIDYELHAEHDGKSSPVKRLSVFDERKDAVIDLKLRN